MQRADHCTSLVQFCGQNTCYTKVDDLQLPHLVYHDVCSFEKVCSQLLYPQYFQDSLHDVLIVLGRAPTFDISMYDPSVVDTFQAFC